MLRAMPELLDLRSLSPSPPLDMLPLLQGTLVNDDAMRAADGIASTASCAEFIDSRAGVDGRETLAEDAMLLSAMPLDVRTSRALSDAEEETI